MAEAPVHLVVMGVSGTGKSTLAQALSERLGWEFAEGDDFHPPENIAAMTAGRPLTDDERWGWLASLAEWMADRDRAGRSTVVSCSALRHSYREILRGAGQVLFVHLTASPELLLTRMRARDHFMPPTLLASQLETLESLRPDEPGLTVEASRPLDELVEVVAARLEAG